LSSQAAARKGKKKMISLFVLTKFRTFQNAVSAMISCFKG